MLKSPSIARGAPNRHLSYADDVSLLGSFISIATTDGYEL
jgi:hypothetical protein